MNHTDNIAYWQALPLACLSVIYCHIVNPIIKRLRDTVRDGKIFPATTLSKWRHGWRIKHPQATNNCENMPHIPKLRPLRRSSIQFRGMGREPKKTPRLRLSTVGRCFAATRSATVFKLWRIPLMIYTFLIQRSRTCRVVELPRIRTISAFGHSEAQARAALAGMPLVFMSRIPSNKGVAA
jgi:hypothetical protein